MSDKPVWKECIFCKRKWDEESIEFDLCPDCLDVLRRRPHDYNGVKLDQYLKYGSFIDHGLADAVKLMWEEINK